MQNVQHGPSLAPRSSVVPADGSRPGVDIADLDRQLTALDHAELTTHAATFSLIHAALTRALAATTPVPSDPPGRPQGP